MICFCLKPGLHLRYTKITEVNLSAFVYRLFHDDFSSICGTNLASVLHNVMDASEV